MYKGLIALMLLFIPSLAFASVAGEVNKANDLYKQGKFEDSLKLYQEALDKDGKSSVIKYDLGTALYKKGDYAKALGYLEQAIQDKNIKVKPKAEYNLGNVLYKSGVQKENINVDEAIKSLQEALGHYGQTIALDPKDKDAVFNQDFVKKEIERLKQKKKQQQNQKQREQNQKQQNQQNQQSSQGQQKPSHTEDSYKSQQEKQQAQQKSAKDQKKEQQKSSQEQAQENQKELDRKQAEDLLEDYKENEEPKKLLNYMPKKIDDRPVLKDW